MKELEKQYNKNVKNPANFSTHRPSYMAGGRAALEWALSLKEGMEGSEVINPEDIEKELEE